MFFSRAPEIPYYRYITRRAFSSNQNPYKFSHARTALQFGLKALDIKKGQEILIPEYICDVVLLTLKQLGILPAYYSVNDSLEPDWNSIIEGINDRTKAILMVHYFGQPQDVYRFQGLCEKYNLRLIEDNAHGYGGRLGEKLLGTFGDIGISSPRKSFGILNGGFLYIKNGQLIINQKPVMEPVNIYYRIGRQILKRIIRDSRILRLLKVGKRSYDTQNKNREGDIQEWAIDRTSEVILNNLDIENIAEKRRFIYNLWSEWVIKQGLKPLFSTISPNISPLAYPAFTSSFEESKKWFDWGYRKGIDIHSWPNLPEELVKNDSKAMAIWKKLICFPIQQEFDIQFLRRKLNILNF